MRGVPYIYPSNDGKLVIETGAGHAEITLEQAEELAAMIWFRIEPERRHEVLVRAYEFHFGNFGCDGVAAELGRPSSVDLMREWAQQQGIDAAQPPEVGGPSV